MGKKIALQIKHIFFLALVISLLSANVAYAELSNPGTESDCAKLCIGNDYLSTYNCYKGTRSKADAYLVTAHCALVNNDDGDAEEFALKSAKQRMEWITWINKLGIKKITIRTGGTAESYMTAYIAASGDKKEEYKEKAIGYAKTSGQCGDNEDKASQTKCAESYFDSYVGRVSKRNQVTGRNTNPELADKTCNGISEYYSFFTGKCKCRRGYETLQDVCTLDVYKNTKLTTESAVELEEKFNALASMQAEVMEITLLKNEKKSIAIQKKPDGSPAYSEDGIDWEKDIKKITNAGFKDKLADAWEWTGKLNPLNWFNTKWKDDSPGQNKQVKWEIAEKVLEEFKEESEEPETYEAQFSE